MDKSQDVIFGALYKANPENTNGKGRVSGYEQNYGLFVPMLDQDTGEVWMIDTYHIQDWTSVSYDVAVKRLSHEYEKKHSTIMSYVFHCYYNACAVLDEKNCRAFELVCVLDQYRQVSDHEARKYSDEDVIDCVKLYREHEWPVGITIARKDAVQDPSKVLEAYIIDVKNSMMQPHIRCDFEKLEKLASEAEGKYDSVSLRADKLRFEKMRKMQIEWEAFASDVAALERTGEHISFDTWEQGVPAADIVA